MEAWLGKGYEPWKILSYIITEAIQTVEDGKEILPEKSDSCILDGVF